MPRLNQRLRTELAAFDVGRFGLDDAGRDKDRHLDILFQLVDRLK
jgi:hypothetical protein